MSTQTLQQAFATFRSPNSSDSAAPPRAGRASLDILTTLAEIDAIAEDWRALADATPEATGFQSYDWCRAWMTAGGKGRDCWRIVVLRERGKLVALLPLQIDRFLGARILRWLGEPWTQYGDALALPGSERLKRLDAAWRDICSWTDVDLVKLGRLRRGAIITMLPAFDFTHAVHCEAAPFVDHSRTSTAAKPDKRLRARQRKLEAIGEVGLEIVTDPERRLDHVREAIALKRQWLRSRNLASTGLRHPRLEGLMDQLATSDTLVVGRLSVGGRTAAIELGLRSNGGFRSLLGCHDPDFATGSPGHLLIRYMIEWSRTEGFPFYDLMLPADAYKTQWSNDAVTVADHMHAIGWRGAPAAAWFRLRPALKALYHRLPQHWRRIPATA